MPGDSDSANTALLRRFPALAALPRASLGVVESPVERWALDEGELWVKRDDLCGPFLAGNKLRALAFLLGPCRGGTTVVTVGGVGSTHVLATASHARTMGIATRAYRWPHEANDLTAPIARAIEDACLSSPVLATPGHAFAAATWRRVRHGDTWIPFGGTSPVGMVGHFGGALELAEQVRRGALPEPAVLCVALGTGGTAAGLALGLAVAGLGTRVIAVRCGPRTGVEGARLRWLAQRLRRFLTSHGAPVGAVTPAIAVDHGAYAGAYGRPHPGAEALRARIRERFGAGLDATYSAKACYAAARRAGATPGPVLFWHTFDARWLTGPRVAPR